MSDFKPMRVVLSGCSGGGKSTLLQAMVARGWHGFAEPGRRVVAQGIRPEDAPERFVRACLKLALADFDAAPAGISLFDRSFLEVLVWFAGQGEVPLDVLQAIGARAYHKRVFLVPPWPEIYEVDAARRHGFEAGVAEFDALCERLPQMGYDCVLVPKLSVAARVDWLEAALQAG